MWRQYFDVQLGHFFGCATRENHSWPQRRQRDTLLGTALHLLTGRENNPTMWVHFQPPDRANHDPNKAGLGSLTQVPATGSLRHLPPATIPAQ